MSLRWKNGKLVEEPYREHLTRRELLLIRFVCGIMAAFTTAIIPSAWTYPKQIWADWIPVGAVIFLAGLFWTSSIWLWCSGARLLIAATTAETDELAPDQVLPKSAIRNPKSDDAS